MLLLTLLLDHGQQVVYVPGIVVNRAAECYRGAGKTDAKDALIIADQARMRRDLTVLDGDDDVVVELRMLVARRKDLACYNCRKAPPSIAHSAPVTWIARGERR